MALGPTPNSTDPMISFSLEFTATETILTAFDHRVGEVVGSTELDRFADEDVVLDTMINLIQQIKNDMYGV